MGRMRFRTGRNVLLGALLTLLLTSSVGCVSVDLWGGGASAGLVESVVRGNRGPKILLVDVDGVISSGEPGASFLMGPEISMVARVRETLDRARQDDEVVALLLRIDSPGGTATASEQIYTEILRYKQERRVPVFAQMLSTATSGGYYVAMAADVVQAHPTTVTGSIGVIFTSLNVVGLMEKLGIEDQSVTAGIHKDAGSPLRRSTPEERAQFQSIVDDLHEQFRGSVERGRPDLTREEVVALSDGRIYSASQALANGLVDRVGTLEDTVEALEERLAVSESRVVAYHRPREIRRNLYTSSSAGSPGLESPASVRLRSNVMTAPLASILSRPGFHFLWWPGISD